MLLCPVTAWTYTSALGETAPGPFPRGLVEVSRRDAIREGDLLHDNQSNCFSNDALNRFQEANRGRAHPCP